MKKNKIFQVLGAAALVGLTTMSLTSCKVVDTIKGWFDDDPVTTTGTPTTPSKTEGNVIVDGKEIDKNQEINYMPKNITFRKNANSQGSQGSVVTFNANVLPENATDKTIIWSLSWNGTCADKVSDYVDMNVTNETHTVTLTCKKVFNTQIKLTAITSGGQKAESTIDVLRRYTKGSVYATRYEDGGQGPYSQSTSIFDLTDNFVYREYQDELCDYLKFGNGTIVKSDFNGEYGEESERYFGWEYESLETSGTIGAASISYNVVWTPEFESYLNEQNATDILAKKWTYSVDDFDESLYYDCIYFGCHILDDDPNYESLLSHYQQLIENYEGDYICQMNVSIKSNYNSQTYNLATGTVYFNYSVDSYVKTTGIVIDNSNVIFQ